MSVFISNASSIMFPIITLSQAASSSMSIPNWGFGEAVIYRQPDPLKSTIEYLKYDLKEYPEDA